MNIFCEVTSGMFTKNPPENFLVMIVGRRREATQQQLSTPENKLSCLLEMTRFSLLCLSWEYVAFTDKFVILSLLIQITLFRKYTHHFNVQRGTGTWNISAQFTRFFTSIGSAGLDILAQFWRCGEWSCMPTQQLCGCHRTHYSWDVDIFFLTFSSEWLCSGFFSLLCASYLLWMLMYCEQMWPCLQQMIKMLHLLQWKGFIWISTFLYSIAFLQIHWHNIFTCINLYFTQCEIPNLVQVDWNKSSSGNLVAVKHSGFSIS